jgi:hypothetical protein
MEKSYATKWRVIYYNSSQNPCSHVQTFWENLQKTEGQQCMAACKQQTILLLHNNHVGTIMPGLQANLRIGHATTCEEGKVSM